MPVSTWLSLLLLGSWWPTVCPLEGPITSDYGARRDPITGERRFHDGIDVARPIGTPVLAPWDTLVHFRRSPNAGLHAVLYCFLDCTVEVTFAHLSKRGFNPEETDFVQAGDVVGYVGSTGRTTGPHLHTSMKIGPGGRRANPSAVFAACPKKNSQ
jgi:murein DD-endopeptidase MepM/ murein hydrolase activator NlpD